MAQEAGTRVLRMEKVNQKLRKINGSEISRRLMLMLFLIVSSARGGLTSFRTSLSPSYPLLFIYFLLEKTHFYNSKILPVAW